MLTTFTLCDNVPSRVLRMCTKRWAGDRVFEKGDCAQMLPTVSSEMGHAHKLVEVYVQNLRA